MDWTTKQPLCTCTGTCYNDYVMGPPATYDDTYFEIRSIHTYHDPSHQGIRQHVARGSMHSGEHAGGSGSPEGRIFAVAWMVFGRHAAQGPTAFLQAPIVENRKFPYYAISKHQTHTWLGAASYHTYSEASFLASHRPCVMSTELCKHV